MLQHERAKSVSAIIFNTCDELDADVLDAVSSRYPPCYGIGPLNLLENTIVDKTSGSLKSNLCNEDSECLSWLDTKAPSSVIYVYFGSVTVMTHQQLLEFGSGLTKSNYSLLWIIRPDLVIGEFSVLPDELLKQTKDRCLLASWCPQEQWSGVPMIYWPFCGDQRPNCWVCCNKWGVAMEIDNDVKRYEVRKLVVELMNGEKGTEMRKNVADLKKKAEEMCTSPLGSSMVNLEKIIHLMKASSSI
ncbi:hypothetical protein Tco_1451987 [Tanacetum coccineum]